MGKMPNHGKGRDQKSVQAVQQFIMKADKVYKRRAKAGISTLILQHPKTTNTLLEHC